jgi:hypothetical protein
MRTLPLLSSVAHTPIGVTDAAAGVCATGAGAGATVATAAAATGATVLATGAGAGVIGAVVATVVGAGPALFITGAAGCGADTRALGAGAVVCAGGGFDLSAAASSLPKPLKPLKPFKLNPEPDIPGAEILMHDSESQFFAASMRIFWPSISKEIELPA